MRASVQVGCFEACVRIVSPSAAVRASVQVSPVLGTRCGVLVRMVPASFKLQKARGCANQSGPQASPISIWQIRAPYGISSLTPARLHTRPSTACSNTPCVTHKQHLTMAHQHTVQEQQKSQRTSPGCPQRTSGPTMLAPVAWLHPGNGIGRVAVAAP